MPSRSVFSLRALFLASIAGLGAGQPARAAMPVAQCVHLTLAHSPAARAAAFQIDAASANERAARAAFRPRLLAEAEYGRSEGFDEAVTNGGSTAALLTLEATLLDGGRRDAEFAAARARLHGAEARAQQERADLALAVREAYFAGLAARAETDIQKDALHVLNGSVTVLREQERQGLVPQNDVLRAQLAVDGAEAARRAAEAEVRKACDTLSSLSGVPVEPADLVEPRRLVPPEVKAEAVEASPLLRDARTTAEAARREIDAVRSERGETVTLTANAGALGVRPGRTFREDGGGQFLLDLRFPLFDGGVVAAHVAAAVAAANAADAAVEHVRQTVNLSLSRAGADARRAGADLTAWQRAVPRSAESFELMRARYFGGGNVRLLEVLDALNQYVEARLEVQRALLRGRVAVATQHRILGEVNP